MPPPEGWLTRTTQSPLVILVRSARPRAAQRDAIRATWASQASGAVFFVLANISCAIPESARAQRGAHCLWARGKRGPSVDTTAIDALVGRESALHTDLVFAEHVDTHRSSNAWLKQAYAWALRNTNAQWFVKVDDDVYVHVQKLSRWLGALRGGWTIVGQMISSSTISSSEGKTSETTEVAARWGSYAPWPRGSAGHAVTRDIAEHVARLHPTAPSFHGEDVSMGLWLSLLDQPGKVRWVHAPWEFSTSQACRDQSRLITGHGLKPAKLQLCARSPCQGKGAVVGKGTGCGPRQIHPPPLGAKFPPCVVEQRRFARRSRAAGEYPQSGECEFRFQGRVGSRWVGSWQ